MNLLIGLLAATAAARVFDHLAAVPSGWKEIRPALDSESISLRIALRQPRRDALEQAVIEISTPGNPRYGKHMTREQVRSFTAPSEKAVSGVSQWLRKSDVQFSVDNDWIAIRTDVGTANELLSSKFSWYQHESGSDPVLRTLSYGIPDDIASFVDLVQPTTRFGQLAAQKSSIFETIYKGAAINGAMGAASDSAPLADSCSSMMTPACLKTLYNIKYTATPSNNLVAVASYLKFYARYSDLETFQSQYVPAAKGQNFSVQLINGGLNDQDSLDNSGEANLDVQYVLGISNPIPILEYSTGGLGPLVPSKDQPTPPGNNEPYLEFLTYVLNQSDSALPQTLSTSYGEEEQSVPREYALKICDMFMQLGARGVSVLFSSGDSGPGNSCVRTTDSATFFNPTFPAGCPYVTSVGATFSSGPERGAAFSSGGFSIYHARPSYQDAVVPAYIQSLNSTYADYYNASGRGIPDVAAQGMGFAVIDKGFTASLSGTSASAPTFAGVVALLNAARNSQGLPPLGFLNPWLYNNSAALTDITAGYSSGCVSNSDFQFGARWNATPGWDPVTGLGTPKFDLLLAAAAPGVANA